MIKIIPRLLLVALALSAYAGDEAGKLYVCNNEGTDITVVSMDTFEVLNTIEVGGQPHGLSITQDGTWAYVSVSGPDEVAAIDTASDTIKWRTGVGPNPHMLTVTPDNRFIYVCIFGRVDETAPQLEIVKAIRSETDVVDVPRRMRVATLDTGKGPHVSYAPNEKHVYITAWFGRHVSVLDTYSHKILRQIPFDGEVRPICIDKAERWMYVALSGLHGFVQADLELGKAVKTVENPPYPPDAPAPEYNALTHGIAIRPGERDLYVTSNVDDKIYIYSIPDCALQGKIDVGDQPNWIAFTPDGSRACISNAGEDTVSIIDADSRTILASVAVGRSPKRLGVVGVSQ